MQNFTFCTLCFPPSRAVYQDSKNIQALKCTNSFLFMLLQLPAVAQYVLSCKAARELNPIHAKRLKLNKTFKKTNFTAPEKTWKYHLPTDDDSSLVHHRECGHFEGFPYRRHISAFSGALPPRRRPLQREPHDPLLQLSNSAHS